MERDPEERKAKIERTIFAQFADTARLSVVEGSIQSRRPPEPDILCELEGMGLVAFELVHLVDQHWARGIEVMLRAQREARDFVHSMQGDIEEEFRRRYADAFIGVEIAASISIRSWKELLPEIISFLLTQPPGIEDMELDLPTNLQQRIRRLSVRRGLTGPIIDPSFASHVGDPTMERIEDKFRIGRYQTEHPMELLAYTFGIDLLLPDSIWRPNFADRLIELQRESEFRRLWVWHGADDPENRRIKLCTPPLAGSDIP